MACPEEILQHRWLYALNKERPTNLKQQQWKTVTTTSLVLNLSFTTTDIHWAKKSFYQTLSTFKNTNLITFKSLKHSKSFFLSTQWFNLVILRHLITRKKCCIINWQWTISFKILLNSTRLLLKILRILIFQASRIRKKLKTSLIM